MNTFTTQQWEQLLQNEAIERDGHFAERWSQLEAKLLAYGGLHVLLQGNSELFAGRLLQRGQLFAEQVQLRPGKPNECHFNAATLWFRHTDNSKLVTGYALTDNIWFAHSWVIEGTTLVETTSPFDCYFGVILDPLEALKFWTGNVGKKDPGFQAFLKTHPGESTRKGKQRPAAKKVRTRKRKPSTNGK